MTKIIAQAEADPSQTVNESVTVTLDASNSVCVRLAYQWQQTAGTAETLTGAATTATIFTAPNAGSNREILSFRSTITDEDSLVDSDMVSIAVR